MRRILFVVLTVMLVFSMAAIAADPKSPTRSLQGVVSNDADAPVERAVVQLKDTKSLQVRSFITKPDGSYHFHGLNPDIDYEVRAEHQGASSDTRTLSGFDSRRTAVINLKLKK